MRRTLASLLLLVIVPQTWAYDAILFSNDKVLSKDFPSWENLLSTASTESPLVVFTLPDFTLAHFSKEAQVYTNTPDDNLPAVIDLVKSSKSHTTRYIASPIELPASAQLVSSLNGKTAADEAIVVAEAVDWVDLDSLLSSLKQLHGSSWTAVLTSDSAVSIGQTRVKRVTSDAVDDQESAPRPSKPKSKSRASVKADLQNLAFPLVIPPYDFTTPKIDNTSNPGDCLFYLEGINIVAYNAKAQSYMEFAVNGTYLTFDFSDTYTNCPKDIITNSTTNRTNANYTFEVNAVMTAAVATDVYASVKGSLDAQRIHFSVTINYLGGFYSLVQFELLDPITAKSDDSAFGTVTASPGPGIDLQNAGIDWAGPLGQPAAFVCSRTQPVFVCAESDCGAEFTDHRSKNLIGISLVNAQIQTYGLHWVNASVPAFTSNAMDCNGAFSTGSWMGIIASLVMATILIFGFLMLNSVQTMDRFDDPKAKQIVINVRE